MTETKKSEPPAGMKASEFVKAKVKRAIAFDGVVIRPDGKKAVEAVIPRAVALAHGSGSVDILGPADPPSQ